LRLFDDFNRDVLGPPGNGKIIILNDSNEEEEVHEEKVTDAEAAPSSVARSPTSIASTDTDDAPMGVKNNNSDDRTPDQEADSSNASGYDAGLP
jgi:hypothetical protein